MINLHPSTRLLISSDLSLKCVERLSLVQRTIEASAPREGRFRWEDPANIRINLAFLHQVDPVSIPLVIQSIEGLVAPLFPFEISIERVFVGPDRYRPRYFYAGFNAEVAEVMELLRRRLEVEFKEFGLVLPKQDFVPSIFLGRGLSNFDSKRALKRVRDLSISTTYIREISLLEVVSASYPPRTDAYLPPCFRVIKRFVFGASG